MGNSRDFGSTEVTRLTGIAYQTLDRWISEGYLTCETPADGTGSRRRFSFRDVVLAIVARTLKEHGLPLTFQKEILGGIRRNWQDEDPAHAGYLAVKLWYNVSSAVWFENRVQLADAVTMADSAKIGNGDKPEPWTGVFVVVDVTHLASQALAEIEEGTRGDREETGCAG
jgi:DNA-binding transcriptional MerR regulator